MTTRTESAQAMATRIMNDPTASFWLKKAVDACMRRDCCDALNDAEVLVELLTKVANDAMGQS